MKKVLSTNPIIQKCLDILDAGRIKRQLNRILAASMVQAQEIVRIANNIFDNNKEQNFFLRMAASFRPARAH